jgi:hypothetical protein
MFEQVPKKILSQLTNNPNNQTIVTKCSILVGDPGLKIRYPGSGKILSRIQSFKKPPDPGSGSATLLMTRNYCFLYVP